MESRAGRYGGKGRSEGNCRNLTKAIIDLLAEGEVQLMGYA